MRPASPSLLDWFRRHERVLAAAYLVFVGFVGVAIVVRPVRVRVLGQVQAVADWWDARWMRRLREGERLLRDGSPLAASAYLERLDRIHPARDVRHGRDKEREFILRMLGESHANLDRRTRAIETYQRLVVFDSLHYRNPFALAQAAERLLSGWALAPEARDAYAAVLRIHPSHLPSVRGYVNYYLDRGEFIPMVTMYTAYLDAHLVQGVEVRVGDAAAVVPILVDGRVRDYEIPISATTGDLGTLSIGSAGFAVAVERIEVVPARQVGQASWLPPLELDTAPVEVVAAEAAEHGAFRGLDASSMLQFRIPKPVPLMSIRLRLGLFKPVDADLWATVEKSYRNLLDADGRAAAAARTVTLASAGAADSVMARLLGANEGLVLRREDVGAR